MSTTISCNDNTTTTAQKAANDFDLFRAVLHEIEDDEIMSTSSESAATTIVSSSSPSAFGGKSWSSMASSSGGSSSNSSAVAIPTNDEFVEEPCSHTDVIVDNNIEICTECGEEIWKPKLSILTDNQVSHASETKMRFVARKSDDRTIFKDIEAIGGFSQRVVTVANRLFQEVTLAAAKDEEKRRLILKGLLKRGGGTTDTVNSTTTTTTGSGYSSSSSPGNTMSPPIVLTERHSKIAPQDLLRPEPPPIANTSKTYCGNSRKSIIFACVFHAFKILGQPRSCDYLINVFQISCRSALKGLKHVNRYAPKTSPLRTSYITPENLVEDIMDKIKATSEQKKEVVELYKRISNRSSKLNRSRPQSVASGLTYYWITQKQKNITLKEFVKQVQLSDLTVSKIATEIGTIVASLEEEERRNKAKQ